MAWNWLQVTHRVEDRLVTSVAGPGGMTRAEAHAVVQGMLAAFPELGELAGTWRAGAKDDTVYAGNLLWAVYEYPEEEGPQRAAYAWVADFAQQMRAAGVDAQMAQPPPGFT